MKRLSESDLFYAFCVLLGGALYLGAIAWHASRQPAFSSHASVKAER